MALRVATIADKEHVLKRVRTHGVEWSKGKVKEVLTDPRYICVLDDEGLFYMYSEDGKTIHAGLHAGFETGDETRYKLLWAFCFKLLEERWPKAKTFAMNVRPSCYAPQVYDVATAQIGMEPTALPNVEGWRPYEVSMDELAKNLGVRR